MKSSINYLTVLIGFVFLMYACSTEKNEVPELVNVNVPALFNYDTLLVPPDSTNQFNVCDSILCSNVITTYFNDTLDRYPGNWNGLGSYYAADSVVLDIDGDQMPDFRFHASQQHTVYSTSTTISTYIVGLSGYPSNSFVTSGPGAVDCIYNFNEEDLVDSTYFYESGHSLLYQSYPWLINCIPYSNYNLGIKLDRNGQTYYGWINFEKISGAFVINRSTFYLCDQMPAAVCN